MQRQKFLFYASGIFVSYFYFGIFQEKITRGKYSYDSVDENGTIVIKNEKFTYALTLVFVQCVINFVVAKISLLTWQQAEDKTRKVYYASMAVTYLLGMVCSNMALQWVSFPTQVVGKSAKPIPVLILGVLLGKKSYALRKYIFVFMIVTGIIIFMLKDNQSSLSQEPSTGLGELLLCLSLIMDGLTGAIQERIRAESKPTGIQMMEIGNAWSSFFLTVTILLTGEYYKFYHFALRHPSIIYNLIVLGLTSAIGQIFLFSMVSNFGPLILSVVTTTRKFFTVLASVLFFGNDLTGRQWLGTVIVFVSLFLDAFYSKSPPKKN